MCLSIVFGYEKGIIDSIFAWRAATGFNGVAVSFDSLSRREDADKLREAAENARPGSIIGHERTLSAVRWTQHQTGDVVS
jgi:hypothetical protein